MTLHVASLRESIDHALHGSPAANLPYLKIINAAGRSLVAAAEWAWLSARETSLAVTDGVGDIQLPADYKAFITITEPNTYVQIVEMVAPQEWMERRDMGGGLGVRYAFVGTVVWMEPSGGGVLAPHLRLWPTPQADTSLNLLYDAQWAEVTEDTTTLDVPDYVGHLLDVWVREYALGLELLDDVSVAQRLAVLKSSFLFEDALQRDSLSTGALIPPGRGAAERDERRYFGSEHPDNLI